MSFDKTYTLEGIIKSVVEKETVFLRHYTAEVVINIDYLLKKRVQVFIPDLGWDTLELAAWCSPRYINGLNTPAVGDFIDVWFMNGDPDQPVFGGKVAELGSVASEADDLPSTSILHESNLLGNYIKHDDIVGSYDISSLSFNINSDFDVNIDAGISIKLGLGNEAFIKGTTIMVEHIKLMVFISSLQNAINVAVPVPADGGAAILTTLKAAVGALPIPTYSAAQLSLKISGE